MEKILELLKELSNFRSGEIISTIGLEIKIAEAIEQSEKIQLTRREWYQKGYNDAMKKIAEGNVNDT